MSIPPDMLSTIWKHLAQRNGWQLVEDEAAFLHLAAIEYERLDTIVTVEARARGALIRVYSTLLYEGLSQRQERAAQELWLAYYRLTLRDGWSPEQARQVAQETIVRVLNQLHLLRSPESCLVWSLKICRSVRRTLKDQTTLHTSLQHDEAALTAIADAVDLPSTVEQALTRRHLMTLITETLSNPLERLVMLRIILFGDHPRDVARDLGLPLYRTRIAKSRALQKLRANAQFLRWLTELFDEMP